MVSKTSPYSVFNRQKFKFFKRQSVRKQLLNSAVQLRFKQTRQREVWELIFTILPPKVPPTLLASVQTQSNI